MIQLTIKVAVLENIMKVVLLVAFAIICVLLVLLVLVQDEDNGGMGGLLSSGNSAAFGSHSASIFTKTTIVLVVLFFVVTLCIAKVLPSKSKTSDAELLEAAQAEGKVVEQSAEEQTEVQSPDWWKAENSEK